LKGWQTKKLAEVTTKIGSGATPRGGKTAYQNEGISLIRSMNVYDGVFDKDGLAFIDDKQANDLSNVVVESGDVLLNITGASVARCCLAPTEFLPARVNQHVSIIRPISNVIDRSFLCYLLTSKYYKDLLLQTGDKAGATRQALTKSQLEQFPISFPPLPEQQRIVAILDEVFEGLAIAAANAEKNLKNAREFFESYLNSVFTQRGEGWRDAKLSAICEKITDGTHQTPTYFHSGFVFLSSRNVTSGFVDWERIKYIDESQHVAMQKRVSPRLGDILLAKNGTTGVAAIVDRDLTFDIYVSLALIRPLKDVLPEYLLHFINSPVAKKQFDKRLKGVGVPNLHLEEIREVIATFPVSIDEQKRVTQKLDSMRKEVMGLEALYSQKLAAIAELKQSILQKAFAGELTKDFRPEVEAVQ
jgi:type I restriction enzyme S subunit